MQIYADPILATVYYGGKMSNTTQQYNINEPDDFTGPVSITF